MRAEVAADAFTAHVKRWSLNGPATAWSDYQHEALGLAERIDHHLARELVEVHALLDGVTRTRA